MRPHISRLKPKNHGAAADPVERHCAYLRRHAVVVGRRIVGVGGGTRLSDRPQRLRQIDAVEDCRGSRRTRSRQQICSTGSHYPLPAAGAGFRGLTPPRSPMSRPGLGPATTIIKPAMCWSSSGFAATKTLPHLSGGEARRAALARVLAPSPDILLLDEPTNHLDLTTIEWLESELDGRRSALVIISHDRRFLSNLSRATAWLDRGQIRQIDRGFASLRGLARRGAGRGRARAAQARPQDRQ